jgi:hypothetical protein
MISFLKPIREGIQALRILPTLEAQTLETLASQVVKPTVKGVDEFINSNNSALNLVGRALENEKNTFTIFLSKISGVLNVFEEQGGVWGNIATTIKQRATALEELLVADKQPATVVVRTASTSNDAVSTSLLPEISQPVGGGSLTLAPNSDSNALKTVEAYLTKLSPKELIEQAQMVMPLLGTPLGKFTLTQLKICELLEKSIVDKSITEKDRQKLITALLEECLQQRAEKKRTTVEQLIQQAEQTISASTTSEDNKQSLQQILAEIQESFQELKSEVNVNEGLQQVKKTNANFLNKLQYLDFYLTDMTSPF